MLALKHQRKRFQFYTAWKENFFFSYVLFFLLFVFHLKKVREKKKFPFNAKHRAERWMNRKEEILCFHKNSNVRNILSYSLAGTFYFFVISFFLVLDFYGELARDIVRIFQDLEKLSPKLRTHFYRKSLFDFQFNGKFENHGNLVCRKKYTKYFLCKNLKTA